MIHKVDVVEEEGQEGTAGLGGLDKIGGGKRVVEMWMTVQDGE